MLEPIFDEMAISLRALQIALDQAAQKCEQKQTATPPSAVHLPVASPVPLVKDIPQR
jgi:hypothetical protein